MAKAIIKRARAATQNSVTALISKAERHWLADFLIEPEPLDDDPERDPRFRDTGEDCTTDDFCSYDVEASGPSLDLG